MVTKQEELDRETEVVVAGIEGIAIIRSLMKREREFIGEIDNKEES